MNQTFRRSSLIIIIFCFLQITSLVAQNNIDTLSIQLIALPSEDSILLRWAPLDFKMWDIGLKRGYKLERFELSKTQDNDQATIIQASAAVNLGKNFKPLALEQWEPLTKVNDFASVAAGAIYGERFTIKDPAHTTTTQIYNVNNEAKNRFGFGLFACDQSFEVAKAAGLAFVDYGIEKGKTYIYKITSTTEEPSYIIKPGIVQIEAIQSEELKAPIGLEGDFSNNAVRLSWDMTPESLSAFTSFQIERSEDDGANFQKRNKLPYVYLESPESDNPKAYYVDTLEKLKVPYQYRILGKTPFGQLSPSSNVVTGQALPPPITAHPFIYNIVEFPENILSIKWRFDNSFNDQIKGFEVYRSYKVDGHYQKISTHLLTITDREFVDESPMTVNYYIIKAIDENDYGLNCVPQLGQLADATPPSPPTGLTANVDTMGKITLMWQNNTEADLLGYRVFFANLEKGNFVQLTSTWVEDSMFYHRLNLKRLNEKAYFKVKAIDYHENYSGFSEILEVKLPDIVPPTAPVFERTEARTTGIYLKWRNSSSEDVVSYKLHRKTINEAKWTTLAEFTKEAPIFEYFDTTASNRNTYHYKILAIDDDEQMSNSKILTMKPIDTGLRAEVLNFICIADRKNKHIQLDWHYPELKNLHEFTIFRAKEDEPMTTYKILTPEDLMIGAYDRKIMKYQFIDTNIRMNTSYRYSIMANFKGGAYSPLTDSVLIEY